MWCLLQGRSFICPQKLFLFFVEVSRKYFFFFFFVLGFSDFSRRICDFSLKVFKCTSFLWRNLKGFEAFLTIDYSVWYCQCFYYAPSTQDASLKHDKIKGCIRSRKMLFCREVQTKIPPFVLLRTWRWKSTWKLLQRKCFLLKSFFFVIRLVSFFFNCSQRFYNFNGKWHNVTLKLTNIKFDVSYFTLKDKCFIFLLLLKSQTFLSTQEKKYVFVFVSYEFRYCCII